MERNNNHISNELSELTLAVHILSERLDVYFSLTNDKYKKEIEIVLNEKLSKC